MRILRGGWDQSSEIFRTEHTHLYLQLYSMSEAAEIDAAKKTLASLVYVNISQDAMRRQRTAQKVFYQVESSGNYNLRKRSAKVKLH